MLCGARNSWYEYFNKSSRNTKILIPFQYLLETVPKSGAEYAYLYDTFSKMHKFWGPLPAFTCNW